MSLGAKRISKIDGIMSLNGSISVRFNVTISALVAQEVPLLFLTGPEECFACKLLLQRTGRMLGLQISSANNNVCKKMISQKKKMSTTRVYEHVMRDIPTKFLSS